MNPHTELLASIIAMPQGEQRAFECHGPIYDQYMEEATIIIRKLEGAKVTLVRYFDHPVGDTNGIKT